MPARRKGGLGRPESNRRKAARLKRKSGGSKNQKRVSRKKKAPFETKKIENEV